MTTHGAFSALLERKPWLARIMLACCSLSLLATSPEREDSVPQLVFRRNVAAPAVLLTADSPSQSFLVTITSEQWPSGLPLTENGDATITGSLNATDVTGDAPFVAVHVERGGTQAATDLNVLTTFSAARSLEFTGSCDAPAGSTPPCTTEILVSFTRLDSGERGGSVAIDWSMALQAQVADDQTFSGPTSLPWSVEFAGP